MSKLCKKATLTRTQIPPNSGKKPSLSDFLTHVHRETSSSVQGLAFATNGTWPVLGFDKRSSGKTPKLCVRPIEGRDFDEDKVFELRLWGPSLQAQIPADGDILAHEFRWLNGVGAVELMLTSGTDSPQPNESKGSVNRGWLRTVRYLEHVPSTRSTTKPIPASPENESNQSGEGTGACHMTALEFIQEEDKYGNTVVVDQLFTGEWN